MNDSSPWKFKHEHAHRAMSGGILPVTDCVSGHEVALELSPLLSSHWAHSNARLVKLERKRFGTGWFGQCHGT